MICIRLNMIFVCKRRKTVYINKNLWRNKMKFKKVLAGALAAVVAVGSLSIAAFADTNVSGDYEYEVLDDGTVSITKYLGEDENVVIPDTIAGMTVTVIGERAFGGNDYIVTVEIPDGVTTISIFAFYGCTSLTEINIPDSVTYISERVFMSSSSLTAINVSENNQYYTSVDGVLFNKHITKLMWYPTGKKETTYTIPDTVTSIDKMAFGYCRSLTTIEIPDGVTEIDLWAFIYCTSLTAIKIPDSMTYIAARAFEGCTSLTVAEIPDSVTKIGSSAFRECTSLIAIEIPDGMTYIDEFTFSLCTSLATVKISDSVTEIGASAFNHCTSLAEIVIPDSVTKIGPYAFNACTSLAEIVIPDSVTEIGTSAFNHCSDNLTIYGYTNSYAETYAKENEITFVALDEENEETTTEPETTEPETTTTAPEVTAPADTILQDTATGISISTAADVLPDGAALNVTVGTETETGISYDITIVNANGETVQPNDTVTVKIPVPEALEGSAAYYVYHQAPDGALTDMHAVYEDGCVTFVTDHFSTYILTTEKLTDDSEAANTTTTTPAPDSTDSEATTAPAPDSGTGSTGNTENTDNDDKNVPTGVIFAILPALAAAAGVAISRKRK